MPTALVTGASAGLGASFARALAAEGSDVVLVARDTARLLTTKVALEERFGIKAEVLSADLGTDDGCAAVAARLASPDAPIDTLVNNAGIGLYQQFLEAPLADEERMLDLNVRAVLRLSHAAAEAMLARGDGLIVNVSSVAAFLPRGAVATYSASKAWVTMFSEALAVQYAGTGLHVTSICPGFTHTEFHQRANADMSGVPKWMWLEADEVVRDGLADARKGKAVSVPNAKYKVLVGASRAMPRPLLRKVMRRGGL
ncbi:hypothetical protein SAMN05444157_0135 [Frankineae bacterium MT45]|nr:hypothetical protein SAMN05444157_0135 [Frankineae bacterium MT45]